MPRTRSGITTECASPQIPEGKSKFSGTRKALEKRQNIYSVGKTSHQIYGAKLPSNRQVLQVFFYNMRFVNLNAKRSALLAVNAVLIYWDQARIPVLANNLCCKQILKLYERWLHIKKHASSKRSACRTEAAKQFEDCLDDLFDISPVDVLERIRIEVDKQFLIMQKKKGSPGCMAGVDMKLYGKEKRSTERETKRESRKRKYEESLTTTGNRTCYIILALSSQ